jgi:HEPN domain-containing protein
MQEFALSIPRTHDLYLLLTSLKGHVRTQGLRRGAIFLTQFAVVTRYPGDDATSRQAKAALRWARRFRKLARDEFGLP